MLCLSHGLHEVADAAGPLSCAWNHVAQQRLAVHSKMSSPVEREAAQVTLQLSILEMHLMAWFALPICQGHLETSLLAIARRMILHGAVWSLSIEPHQKVCTQCRVQGFERFHTTRTANC